MANPTATLEAPTAPLQDPALVAAAEFLAGYKGLTRSGYTIDLRGWWRFCELHNLPIFDVRRPHVEMYIRSLEEHGYARSTIARRISTVACYYQWCVVEDIIVKNPVVHVHRPKPDRESSTLGLDRNELGAFLVQAGLSSTRDHALAVLLGLNGLRVSEACNANIEDLASGRGHRTLTVLRKGGHHERIPLAPRTARAIDLAVGERCEGPILLRQDGNRLDRNAAYRIVKRLAKKAGVTHRVSPHSLRHAAITGVLDAGVDIRDAQAFAGHADPRTTIHYDRHRGSLDRHATYILAAYVAGASGGPN